MPWNALLRGAIAGLLLFHVAHLASPGPHRRARLALAAFTASVLAYLFCSWPGRPPALPLLALCTGAAPLLWLAMRALFDDGFRFTPLALALPAAAMLAAAAAHGRGGDWPALHALVTAGFAVAALWEVGRGWRDDLVEPRRRARRWVALGIGVYVAVVLAVEAAIGAAPAPRWLEQLHLTGIGAVALALALVVARHSLDELLGPALPVEPAVPAATAQPAAAPSSADAALLDRLLRAMTEQHAYRREGLTLAALGGELGVGEAALRRLINQRLGHRNFSDFLHRYRIDEAAARLAREDLPVLTIALECGYGSIGPFNRAFKERMGMTPSQYRGAARLPRAQRPSAR